MSEYTLNRDLRSFLVLEVAQFFTVARGLCFEGNKEPCDSSQTSPVLLVKALSTTTIWGFRTWACRIRSKTEHRYKEHGGERPLTNDPGAGKQAVSGGQTVFVSVSWGGGAGFDEDGHLRLTGRGVSCLPKPFEEDGFLTK